MAYKVEIAESLKRMNGLLSPTGSRILDVGCGTKIYSGIFSNHQYIGIDVEQSGRDESGKKPDAYFDGERFPIPIITLISSFAPKYWSTPPTRLIWSKKYTVVSDRADTSL